MARVPVLVVSHITGSKERERRLGGYLSTVLCAQLTCSCGPEARLAAAVAGAVEGDDGAVVRVGEGVQVLLGGCDAAVAETLLDDLQVGAPASSQEA